MIISLLLLQAGTIGFPGGGDADLVAAIGAKLKQPVAILAEPGRKWPKVTIAYTDQADLRRDIASRFGLRYSTPGLAAVEAPWPREFFYTDSRTNYASGFRRVKPLFEKETPGTVSLATPEGAVPLDSIRALRLSKPLAWHWFYDGAYVAASMRNVTERQMLSILATAVGAKLTETNAAYSFDFDPAALKRRMNGFGADAQTKEERSDDTFVRLLVRRMDDAKLRELYKEKGNSIELSLPVGTQIYFAGIARVQARMDLPKDLLAGSNGAPDPIQFAKENIDWTYPPSVRFGSNGVARLKYKGKQRNSWFYIMEPFSRASANS